MKACLRRNVTKTHFFVIRYESIYWCQTTD